MPKVEPAPVTLTDPSLSDHNAAMVCGNSDIKTARQGKPRTSSVPSTTKLQMQLSIPPSGELNRDSQVDSKSGSRKTVQDTSIGPCPSYDFPDPRFDSFAGSDEGRRKRRRTAPPISESHPPIKADEESWEKQLEAAAASGEDTVVRGRALQVPKSEQSPVVADGLPPDKSTMSSFLDSTPVRKGTKPTKESTSSNSPELNAKRKTPPKKMLKLSSDGKFGSPSSRSIVNETRLRRRKPTSQDLSTKKIVVMRYGSNRSSQLSIGQKIQEILARPRGIVKAGQLSARPQEPLKPTHPFFLGKSNRISGRETHSSSHSVAENSEVVSGLSEGERRTSPRKRRTSGESRANVEAWAGLSGFRSATRSAQATREPKFPGAVRPIWPPKRMLHLRGCTDAAAFNYEGQGQKNPPRRRQYRKLKNAQFELPRDEDILDPYLQLSHVRADALQSSFRYPRSPEALRRPTRILMEGPTLQGTMLRRLNHDMTRDRNHDQMSEDSEYRCGSSQNEVLQSHSALPRLYNSLATSLAAFDKFECEQLEWIHKYSPKCAKEVLQPGREAILLRDWLKGLTVTSVDSGKTRDTSKGESGPPKKTSTRPKKKRRKLDGFVISSDEENNEMDEISDVEDFETFQRMQLVTKKSVVRAGDSTGQAKLSERSPKATNAVVISGPHGCGKTASVYAVARELGFEVFEINAGSRRSGKDLLEKVGEMTRNHLVRQDSEECTTSSSNNLAGYQQPTEKDIGSERRSTMNAFLKPQQKTKSKSKRSRKSKASDLRPETMKKPQRHKQSLILLEEVDVLFEEDKLFWTTTLDLIKQSKRPIIMTCTDEARLPLSDMILHAIFRLVPIPENLAIDYLVLLAGAEGHILSRDSLSLLYRARNRDLRASIAELNFYCQMGIGDTKGGLEWMLTPPSSKGEKVTERGLRVLSEGTYLEGMGFLSHDQPHEDNKGLCEKELELLSQAFDGWNIDAEDWYDFMDPKLVLGTTHPKSRQESLKELDDFQQVFEALSAADTFPDSHFSCRMDVRTLSPVRFLS